MSLSRYKVCPGDEVTFLKADASVAVSDLDHAKSFYEGKLGFSRVEGQSDGSLVYTCGGGTTLRVYASPIHAGKATATLATWYVNDLEQVVAELRSNGVTFERNAELPLKTESEGIHELADGEVAWFKDPDGNTFAVEQ
jgi:catechol 2,3-dioxygenase-like lactoylglutathione lyase family enzyme